MITQFLCTASLQARCRKVTSPGFFHGPISISSKQYWISLKYLSLLYQNKVTCANEIQYCCKEIQVQSERNPMEVTLRQLAHREAGTW